MGAGVVGGYVVAVVGGDDGDIEFALHLEDGFADGLIGLEAVVLDLEEEVALAEHLLELASGALGFVVLPCHQVLVDLACQAAGEANETFGVAGEEFFRDPGFAVKPCSAASLVRRTRLR